MFGVTPQGFKRKRLVDVEDDLRAEFRSEFGSAIKTGPQTVFGTLIGIWAAIIASIWELAASLYSMLDPEESEGAQLEVLASVLGLTRIDATPSLVALTLTGDPSTVIPQGTRVSRSDDNTIEFETLKTVTIGGSGTIAVTAKSSNSGPVEAPPGALTEIVTPIAGLDAVTNATGAKLGLNVETDEGLRLRMKISPAIAGGGTVESIRASLLELFGVTAVSVIDNDTPTPDADGRIAHSIEAVVSGGDDEEIAQLLWRKKPAGTRLTSTAIAYPEKMQIVIQDSQGFDRLIQFTRPETVEIYVGVQIVTLGGFTLTSEQLSAVELAVLQAATGYTPGVDVKSWRLRDAVTRLGFIMAATEQIDDVFVYVGKNNPPMFQTVPISSVQVASFDATRIGAA